jgi:hypothetical protein
LSDRKIARKPKHRSSRQRLSIPYVKEKSNIFKNVFRPKVDIQIYSQFLSSWISVEEVLADTGADISVIPKSLGVLLVGNVRRGKRFRITGLVAGATKYIYLHNLRVRIGDRRFKAAFAIAATDDVPPTLGRIDVLDKLTVEYKKGRQLVISW